MEADGALEAKVPTGKLVALIDRHAARDLFDARRILSIDGHDWDRIKAAVLAIGASGQRDWRTRSTDAIEGDPREFRQKFAICLPHDCFAATGNADVWIEETVAPFDLKPESENALEVHTKAYHQAKALL